MPFTYPSSVKIVDRYLQLLQVRVHISSINERLIAHPDYPSFLAISDVLRTWSVPNGVGHIDRSSIDALPVPFLTPVHESETKLIIVKEVAATEVIVVDENGYEKKCPRENFLNTWTGSYLFSETTSLSGDRSYSKSRVQDLAWKTAVIVAGMIIAWAAGLGFMRFAVTLQAFGALQFWLMVGLCFIGLVLSFLLFLPEINHGSKLLNALCGQGDENNCESVLNDRLSKFAGLVSWSEIGICFYGGQLLILIFGNGSSTLFGLSLWLYILTLPYVIFSVSYQAFVLKKWCILCCLVQLVNIVGIWLAVSSWGTLVAQDYVLQHTVSFLVSLLVLPALWIAFKPALRSIYEFPRLKKDLARLLYNFELFELLLSRQPKLPTYEGVGLEYGSKEASHTLIAISNLHCRPCATMHERIQQMLEKCPNLKVQVIFTDKENAVGDVKKTIHHLLSLEELKGSSLAHDALSRWFSMPDKNYPEFQKIAPPTDISLEVVKQAAIRMSSWIKHAGVRVTPTLFVDGYKIPDGYQLEDLETYLSAS